MPDVRPVRAALDRHDLPDDVPEDAPQRSLRGRPRGRALRGEAGDALRVAQGLRALAAAAAPAVAASQTRAVAAQLTKLFADFDTSAVTFAEENQASLRPAFDAATWEQFLRRTQEFAFADAQVLLDQALAHLPAS